MSKSVRMMCKYKNSWLHIGAHRIKFDTNGYGFVPEELVPKLLKLGDYELAMSEVLWRYKRILIMRDAGVGDILMCTPLISYVRERAPDAHITFATLSCNLKLLEGNPDIDEIADMAKTNPAHYEAVIDLSRYVEHHKDNLRMNRLDLFAESICATLDSHQLIYNVSPCETALAKKTIQESFNGK